MDNGAILVTGKGTRYNSLPTKCQVVLHLLVFLQDSACFFLVWLVFGFLVG